MNVASFNMNHDDLERGVFVSRKDKVGAETLTTFDIRMKLVNREPVIDNPAIHTLEHLMAVYLRGDTSGVSDTLIYIGPMGCRTGMYLIFKGDLEPKDILEVLKNTFKYIINFEGKIPATTSRECGNYLDHNLFFAQWESKKYLEEVLENMKPENMIYPV